jgi:hypothetical protein
MSNVLSGNPWIVDTVSTSLTTNDVYIARLRWVGATTAGHTVTVQDGASNHIWGSVASASNNVEDAPIHRIYSGLQVPTLGSGTLYITFETRPKHF